MISIPDIGRSHHHLILFTRPLVFYVMLCFVAPATLRSQTSAIDKLRKDLYGSQQDKLSALFGLCRQGSSLPSDSFMLYAQKAKQMNVAKNDFTGSLMAEYYTGKCYVYEGKADSGLRISEAGMKQVTDPGSLYSVYHQLWGLKITCLTKLRKFDETFSECYKMLESGEKFNDLAARAFASNSIGSAYFNFSSDFINAKKWWYRAYRLLEGSDLLNDLPQVLVNLSYLYYGIDNNLDSAQFFLNKAFAVAGQTQSLKVFADCYTTQADIYNLQHKTADAEKMLQKGVAIYKQIGNTESIIESLATLGDFYTDRKEYAKAIIYQKETEEYLDKSHSGNLTEFYRSFAESYEKTGNYAMADSMLRKFIRIQDSLYAKAKVEDLARLEAKYELSSKEASIARQKLELLHKNIWIGAAALITLLIASGTYFLFRRSRRRQVIALTEAEEKERRRIAADLHDNIGAYASAISAGIDEIESRKLITDTSSLSNLKNNAAEIISSLRDTIWAFNKESISLTGISDRVKVYVQKIQPNYPSINIKIEETISPEKNLSPVRALHVFRIIQEALHNAIKHSKCDTILLHFSSNAESATISVEDNGIGFDPPAMIDSGNGLLNIKNRAKEAGFDLRFIKASPNGTKIILHISS